ncbi:MAG: class I tRNA ligase family protein, partial [Candidatus Margulisbacteria bacterium]|nr:class I tRNA ligase family protein [Candidatus Margulisiibacteriota bacterium]
ALSNYITALGYPNGEHFKKFWPVDAHLMGKEIVRFHAVTWPCMLLALGVPLPKKVFGHGWWTVEGKKMSKSKGNVVDPIALSREYGVDAVRYFLMREVPFGADGDFSIKHFIERFNADLANDIGNLLNRTLTMVEKYFDGVVPEVENAKFDDTSKELVALIGETPGMVDKLMDELAFSDALAAIWRLINKANTYIEKEAPWKAAKEGNTEKLGAIMYNLVDTLRAVANLVSPFMPTTSQKMWGQLGFDGSPSFADANLSGVKIKKGEPLFPRLEK